MQRFPDARWQHAWLTALVTEKLLIGMRWRSVVLALSLILFAPPGVAANRPEGLLWNRSGLAATIPLQVKTNGGSDYVVELYDAERAQTVLAAYIRGGEFFRVLVPPGSYHLFFATGTDWQSEATQFGPDTRRFLLVPALTFRATVSQKNGHLIDLRDPADTTVRDIASCQHYLLDPDSLRNFYEPSRLPGSQFEDNRLPTLGSYRRRYDVFSRLCF